MISHLLKGKSALLVLFLLICSIPFFSCTEVHKTSNIDAYKQAIRINPDDADAHYNLGVAYGKLGKYQEAMDAFKQAIRFNPDYA